MTQFLMQSLVFELLTGHLYTATKMPVAMERTERSRRFKNTDKDMDHMRRNRADITVEIRKNKKEDQLAKKRQISDMVSATDSIYL